MKLKLLSVICLIPMLGLTQAPISYFEFNDTAGASFNTFVNSGSDSTTWNNGASGAVITDGANLVVQGGTVDLAGPNNGPNTGQNGQIFRKILYPTTYDSGQYRLEIDFASWDLDVNQADSGKIEIGVYEASGFATKAASIALKQQADGYRIQFFGEIAGDNTDIYRNYDVTNNNSTVGSGIFALDVDLDANTITPYTNGVAMTSAITVDDKVIGNFQFTCQNLSSNSTAAINRMGLIDLNGTAGGGGDGTGGGSSDSAQGLNENTDASSHWDFDDDYGATALEHFKYNSSGKQFAAMQDAPSPTEQNPDRLTTWGVINEGTLDSGFNAGGGNPNTTDGNGNVTFYGKGGQASSLYRTMPSTAGYTNMPTTGVLSFVVDLDSWNLDTNALSTGSTLDISAYNGDPGNNDVLTGVTVNAHTNGQGRIQVKSSIAGGTSPQQYRTLYYPLSTTNLPKITVELDLDNDTVVYLTNDVVWQQAPNLTNINATAELTHIRFGMGSSGSTNSTIKVDGFAVYQRIDASEVIKIPVNVDGSEFSGSSVYMGGTNFVLNFASTNIASTAFATNGFANSGQDFFLGAYHSTVIDPAVLADLALNSAVTNDGGGRGAVVLSSHGTENHQHGGFRIQEQSLQNQISYNQLAPTPGSTSDGVVIYKQDEFLDGLSSGNVAFEAGADTLSVELDFAGKERMSEARFSWVIEDNGTFYRSQPITMTHGANEANVANANTLTNLSANALAVNWYTYDETAVDVNNIGGAATPTLQKIGGIGFIYGVTWTGATETGGNWARYQVQSFSAEGATAAVVSEISTWLTQNGLTVTTGDADGDGRVDLLEYALGTNPGVSDTAGISGEVSDGYILFTHAKRAGIDHGVTYTVQTNANLKFPVWADSTTVPATETSSTVTHTIETATEDELFIRLKVELDD